MYLTCMFRILGVMRMQHMMAYVILCHICHVMTGVVPHIMELAPFHPARTLLSLLAELAPSLPLSLSLSPLLC
jgi:hypothetical protein